MNTAVRDSRRPEKLFLGLNLPGVGGLPRQAEQFKISWLRLAESMKIASSLYRRERRKEVEA